MSFELVQDDLLRIKRWTPSTKIELKRSCLLNDKKGHSHALSVLHKSLVFILFIVVMIYLLTVSLFLSDFASTSSNHSHCFSDSSDIDRALTTAPFSLAPFCKFNLASSLFECDP